MPVAVVDQIIETRLSLVFSVAIIIGAQSSQLFAHSGNDHVAEDENLAKLAQNYAPFEVAPETINVPVQADFDVFGSWGPVINWPHIPVSAANLADGRILTWASNQPNAFPGGTEYTFATVWDPQTNTFTDVPHDSHDMFCSHQVVLEDGRIFVSGGRNHVSTTSVFDSASNTWSVIDQMNNGRWYPTSVSMSDGGVLIAIGSSGGRFPEVWHPGLGWKSLTGIDLQSPILDFSSHYESNWWPFLSVKPDGDVLHYGPTPNMHSFNVTGTGSITALGTLTTDWYPKHGASVMYDDGKILLAGGATSGSNQTSTNKALLIDTNGPTPVITPVTGMSFARKFQNAVALANGEVMMVGGNTSGTKFNDSGTVLTGEIWNPVTETWRHTADMSVPRNYHSIALLTVDGRVLSGGGGLCGGCAANHQDAQIYSPPYLFNADGTLATRPVLSSAPDVVLHGEIFTVNATPSLQRFTMIKMSSTTHAVNTDQRFLNVSFNEPIAGQYQLIAESNKNILTPGYYFLFGLNAQGVPSIAEVVQISAGVAPSNYPPSVLQAAEQTHEVGDDISLTVSAIDIDDDAITFAASNLPSGLSINAGTGEITGILSTLQSTTVSVTVSDGSVTSEAMTFVWNVILPGDGMGSILREWWTGISGNPITNLTGNVNYPDNPTGSEIIASFEAPTNWADNYGTRMSGYIHAPITGDYIFWIASDDEGQLWLSSDTNPANVSMIANVPGWSNSRVWDKYTQQQSQTISLQAGQAYYLEALQKEGGGGDNLAVAWQLPGASGQTVISGIYLTPFGFSPTNKSPTISNPGQQVNLIGSNINLALIASDPDNDTLAYSASGLPTGLLINTNTGVITGTANTNGNYEVTVTVDDGGGRNDSVLFNWQITLPVNNPPTITVPANQINLLGDSISLTVTADDPDGDTLTFSATGLPPGALLDTAMGIITGNVSATGTFNVNVTVSDGNNGTDNDNFSWTINVPPLTLNPIITTPVEINTQTSYTAVVQGGTNPQYKWDFGDGSPETAFSTIPAIDYTYINAGRYIVTLTVSEDGGNTEQKTFIQTIHQPLTINRPATSMSVIYQERSGNDRLWNVNPDNNTVSAFDVITHNKVTEIFVDAGPRSLASAPDGRIWVVNKHAASINIINPEGFNIESTVFLPTASQPFAVVFDPVGNHAYVSLEATGQIIRLNPLDGSQTGMIDVTSDIRHLSITADSARLLAARFITPPVAGEHTASPQIDAASTSGGEIIIIDAPSLTVSKTVILHHSDDTDAEDAGRGIPNYLGPAVISPDGASAWVASKKDNIKRGSLRDGNPLTHDSAVRSISSRIDMLTELEDLSARVDHDDAGVASTAIYDHTGNYLYVALEGSREVSMLDTFSGLEIARIDAGRAPQGLVLSPDGQKLYVHNFMDRSITVHDLTSALTTTNIAVTLLATYDAVTIELLNADVLLGKQHFYDASDSRLALQKYISCAACHNDGAHDGRTWDFTGFGEGIRNTIDLRGHAGTSHGPLHWSANFDEVQDFEGQIRGFGFGLGLMNDTDFHTGTRSQPLGDSKSGFSVDLDALSAYVTSLSTFSNSPYRNTDGTLTAAAKSGRVVFLALNCDSCHNGEKFTDSVADNLHDIGTITAASGNRLNGVLTGIDTPTLRGVWTTMPYLHDGSAATLEEAVTKHSAITLSSQQLTLLVAYLQQIGGLENAPVDSDGDFLPDDLEIELGTNPSEIDSDGDTLNDYDELNIDGNPGDYNAGTDLDPRLPDTDLDQLRDDADPLPTVFNFNDGDLAPLGSPDGQINAADLLISQRIVLGIIEPGELELSHGDLYPVGAPDGQINLSDMIILHGLILGN